MTPNFRITEALMIIITMFSKTFSECIRSFLTKKRTKRTGLFESQWFKSSERPTHMTVRLRHTLSPDFREKTCGNRMPTPHSYLLPLIMIG